MSLEERLAAFRSRQGEPGLRQPPAPKSPLFTWESRLDSPEPLCAGRSYLDIETTGFQLGMPVILIGWAHPVTSHELALWQGSPTDLDREGALLEAAFARAKDTVVTYNGAAFDLPRLAARAILWDVPLPTWPHLDLLPDARRLYGHTLPRLSLSALEESLLCIHRGPDLPGDAMAENFRLYLETGERSFLNEVAAHNRHDLLALARLDARIAADAGSPSPSPSLAYGQGRFHLARKDAATALDALCRVPADDALSQRAAQLAARAAKEAGEESVAHLRRATGPLPSPRAELDLARALERERGDFEGALKACEDGLAALHLLGFPAASTSLHAALARRAKRLSRKIDRRQTTP